MKPTIALFLHQPKCSIQSGNGIMKALSPHYNFKIFTKHELEDNFFDDVAPVLEFARKQRYYQNREHPNPHTGKWSGMRSEDIFHIDETRYERLIEYIRIHYL